MGRFNFSSIPSPRVPSYERPRKGTKTKVKRPVPEAERPRKPGRRNISLSGNKSNSRRGKIERELLTSSIRQAIAALLVATAIGIIKIGKCNNDLLPLSYDVMPLPYDGITEADRCDTTVIERHENGGIGVLLDGPGCRRKLFATEINEIRDKTVRNDLFISSE